MSVSSGGLYNEKGLCDISPHEKTAFHYGIFTLLRGGIYSVPPIVFYDTQLQIKCYYIARYYKRK